MKKRLKQTPNPARVSRTAGTVVRISQEAWAAKCSSRTRQGGLDVAESYDRALRLTRTTKVS